MHVSFPDVVRPQEHRALGRREGRERRREGSPEILLTSPRGFPAVRVLKRVVAAARRVGKHKPRSEKRAAKRRRAAAASVTFTRSRRSQ